MTESELQALLGAGHAMTPVEAAQLVEADKQSRLQAFGRALELAAQEYRCDLVALPQVTPDGRLVAVIQAIAK